METGTSGNIDLTSDQFLARVAGGTHTLEVFWESRTIRIDGDSHNFDFAPMREKAFSLLLNGHSFEVHLIDYVVENGTKLFKIIVNGSLFEVSLENHRSQIWKALTAVGTISVSKIDIKAPMPGKVIRVEVKDGQRISSGQGLCVLEAMKMENEIKTPAAGLVERVHVSAGQSVEKDEKLISIKPH